jgi:hypothetical protein
MKRTSHLARLMLVLTVGFALPAFAAPDANPANLDDLLSRASAQVARLVDQFSNVQCTEHVEQAKLRADGKLETREQSTFNYLVLLTDNGGDLSLQESRIAVHEAKGAKKNTPMLLSNGFATLFLVFHPLYSGSFHFTSAGSESLNGHAVQKVLFEHLPGMRSPAALALRGREYPLELSGTAWIDVETGAIAKIEAGVGDTLVDVGLKSLQSEIEFAPTRFHDVKQTYWLPVLASVEVETPRQHWRNTHRFSDYKEFSVTTEEKDKKVEEKKVPNP